ncbi:MAG: T9SS type A sorting domain-containing protein [Bacteroidetes bacterium]|nr:T9SS type A sorting domain-containing protein [Bacteroidota bacterium]
MKYLIVLILFVAVSIGLKSQTGNHIHHLYGLSEPTSGLIKIQALNQQSNIAVEIETFSSGFSLGEAYAYALNSNQLFLIENVQPTVSILNTYFLPEIYFSNFTGQSFLTTQGTNVSAFCVNPIFDNFLYSFSVNSGLVQQLNANGGVVLNSTLSFDLLDELSLKMFYFDDRIYLTGSDLANGTSKIYMLSANGLSFIDSAIVNYASLSLSAHPQFGVYGIAQNAAQENVLVELGPTSLILTEKGNLPSCVSCTTESVTFDRNALVIDNETNSLIAVRSETIAGNIAFYLSTFSLSDGSTIYEQALSERISNLIFVKPLDDLVYPGDANHDKIVNMEDLLPIGLKYNDLVSPRTQVSTAWIGQMAQNTNDTLLLNGADRKHADCNGDGQINEVDLEAIYENYSYMHYSEKSTNANCDFPLYMVFPALAKEEEQVSIGIGIDLSTNSLQNIYGLSFTLEYDTNFVLENTLFTEGVNTWFGVENSDYIQISIDDYKSGKVDIGITGIDKLNRTGGGVLLNGVWTMEGEVIPISQSFDDMTMRISNVVLIDFEENLLDACGIDTSMRVYSKEVSVLDRTEKYLDLAPNPSKLNYISLSELTGLIYVEMYDLQGKLLEVWNDNFDYMNIAAYNKGVYLIKAHTKEESYYAKLLTTN